MRTMKLIEALQLPEVLEGRKRVANTLDTNGHIFRCQTFRVVDGEMRWVDNQSSASFRLRQLTGPCVVLDDDEDHLFE